MAATALLDDVAADLDFNIDADADFDVRDLDVFDLDDLGADEFCDAYSAFVANADAKRVRGGGGGGWLAGLSFSGGGGGEGGSLEGSPDSVVTTDGPLAGEEAMSSVVAELERYLMEDGDDVEEVFCADGDGVEEQHICVDDFFGDLLGGSDFNGIVTAAAGAALRKGVEDNDDGDRVEEHICVDDDFFGDLLGSSDFNGIVGTASSSAGALHDGVEEDNDDGDVLAAREDEQPASRKRARAVAGSLRQLSVAVY